MHGGSNGPVQITEDEAALYDRQIRLWGLEAQQRMRNAKILVFQLRGLATEIIKNLVLSGIGTLVIVDWLDVSEEDLGSGFFLRDEDVGEKRVLAAKVKVESLNPLVAVNTISSSDIMKDDQLEAAISGVDLVCATDWSRSELFKVNEVCRRLGKPFYAGGTYGLLGYIFCDLLEHDYIAQDRSSPKEGPKNIKMTAAYVPLQTALQYRWTSLTKRQTKELNPAVIFSVLAVWEFEARHGRLPDHSQDATALLEIAETLFSASDVNKESKAKVSSELIESISTTARHEISPVCAVVGGILAQDILKALGKKEAPIANFLVFNGSTGGATACRMNMLC